MKLFRSKSRRKKENEAGNVEKPSVDDRNTPLPRNPNQRVTAAPIPTQNSHAAQANRPPEHVPQGSRGLKHAPMESQKHSQTLQGAQASSSISQTLAASLNLEEEAERSAVTRELVKKFVADIWNRGDLDLIPSVCGRSLRFNGSVGMDRVGHDGFARMVTTIRDALNDYHCEIHSMVVEGNKAFCRMRFTGRHTGPLLGYSPTGRQVAWMGAAEFTCKDGLIVKVWELGDVKSLEEQLSGV